MVHFQGMALATHSRMNADLFGCPEFGQSDMPNAEKVHYTLDNIARCHARLAVSAGDGHSRLFINLRASVACAIIRVKRTCAKPWLRAPELPLHAFVETRHVDDDALVGAAADRLLVVARLDPKRHRAPADRDHLAARHALPSPPAARAITH